MVTSNRLAEVAAAVGEPARAAMLTALMDGRALTATELAGIAAISPPTASSHLTRLIAAGLVCVERQGRHRYHRLAGPEVAQMIESLMQIAGAVPLPSAGRKGVRVGPRDVALRTARTCYDHLAGQLGVSIADALRATGAVDVDGDCAVLTEAGHVWAQGLGLRIDPGSRRARPICRPCLDWSERRPHLAGLLGAAICRHAIENSWVRQREGTRSLEITPKGQAAFKATLGITISAGGGSDGR